MTKLYPIGIQDFESLRNDGYLYIDKTSLIYNLTHTGRYYLMSRPRRFGKSLLVSTLSAYFRGKRELFKGLAMEELEKDWTAHPVIHIDLNNLKDISMDQRYIEICGITEQEIHQYLEPELNKLAQTQSMTYEEVCHELKERYDGYHFKEDTEGIYNPFSVLNTFDSMGFGSYWFETGTPSYLVKLLKRDKYDLRRLAHDEATSDVLNSIDSTSQNPLPVIYQSGYLTIKGYDKRFGIYELGFPNKEVEEGFIRYLLPFYANIDKGQTTFHITRFVNEIEDGDYDSFRLRLQSFFADTPYELIRDLELHYQNVLFIVYKLLGFYVKAEYHTSNGRIDLVLQTNKYIYIMEFKFDGSAEEALVQIEEKGYAVPFSNDPRKRIKIGVNFSSKSRNIEKWLVIK